jgi:putative hydrolase of the HAD superfamily
MRGKNGAQTLLIDADDTLWENNIYFERAIAAFISFLDHREHSPEAVRLVLNDVERDSIVKHGYGLHSFVHSLIETFEKLSVDPVTPELHERIRSFAHQIADHPIEVLPGVPETLHYLGERHHLILMTKGNPAEQSGKVERSGLKEYFSAVEIVAEKDESTYRSAIAKYALPADTTWMVGNSPKSDINPALAAGLHRPGISATAGGGTFRRPQKTLLAGRSPSNRHKPGTRNFFRSRPALLSTWKPT